jgi:molecular chaperone GrpE
MKRAQALMNTWMVGSERVLISRTTRNASSASGKELALENRPQDGNGAEFANGIELIYQKLIATLEKEGVSLMDVDGQEFDPAFHEALSSEDSEEYESGKIIAVVKSGYVLGDRVLRPALVRVAR